GYGWSAGMDGALNAILARPSHHVARGRAIFYTAQADFAEHSDTGCGEFLKILLHHAMLDDRRTGMNPHSARTEGREGPLRENCHRLQPDNVLGTAGSMNLSCGNHGGDTAVQVAIDPAELVLPGSPVARYRMNVAVNEAGSERGSLGVNDSGRALGV